MRICRNSFLLALALLIAVQGAAVAAVPAVSAAAGAASLQAADEMPCADAQSSCCDADCADMSSCMLGQYLAVPAVQLAALPAVPVHAPERPRFRPSPPASRLLRPPQVLHA